MKFFNLFRKARPATNDDPEYLFFHEDDYCQVELLPRENFSLVIEESQKSAAFARQNFDGVGYTDIYIRSNPGIALKERNILPHELESVIVESGLKRVRSVMTGYGENYRVELDDTLGFGEDYSAIYFDVNDGIVDNIWLTGHLSSEVDKFRHCLPQIGQR